MTFHPPIQVGKVSSNRDLAQIEIHCSDKTMVKVLAVAVCGIENRNCHTVKAAESGFAKQLADFRASRSGSFEVCLSCGASLKPCFMGGFFVTAHGSRREQTVKEAVRLVEFIADRLTHAPA